MNLVYKRKLDKYNRVVIPAALRKYLGSEIIGTYNVSEDGLYLYTAEKFNKISNELQNSAKNDRASRNHLRSWYSFRHNYFIDKRGRIKLSYLHIHKINIKSEVWFELDPGTQIVEVKSSDAIV